MGTCGRSKLGQPCKTYTSTAITTMRGEDADTTIQQIEEWFGKDVAFLVHVVTKTKKEKYELGKQVDNFKQMLDSVKYDIRALLIKLADRLHNMRTLSSMRPDKQMKIAGETDFFYAPLANRLGLYQQAQSNYCSTPQVQSNYRSNAQKDFTLSNYTIEDVSDTQFGKQLMEKMGK